MAANNRRELVVAIVSDASTYSKGLDQASRQTQTFGKQMDRAAKGGIGQLDSRVTAVTASLKGLAGVAGVAAIGSKVVQFADESIQAFSDLEQAAGGTEAVFGDASDAVDAFATSSAKAIGLSEAEFRTATTAIGGQLKRMTGDVDLAAEQSIRLTQVAADLAATYGGTTAEAVEALGSAFRGEADPAERFNLDLKVSKANAEAVRLGLAETTSSVDDYARAQAILSLITTQSADAQGQFAREADSAAGHAQITAAQIENMKARAGEAIVPFKKLTAEIGLFAAENASLGALFLGDVLGTLDATSSAIQRFEVQTGLSADSAAAAITIIETYGGSFEDLIPALSLSESELNLLRFASDDLLASFGLNATQIEGLRQATAIYVDDVRKGRGAQNDFRTAVDETSTAYGNAASTAAQVSWRNRSLGELRTALQETEDAARNTRLAILEATNPAFAAVSARQRESDAAKNLEDVRKNEESTAKDIAAAELELAQARIEAYGALEKFDASGPAGQVKTIADALKISITDAQALLEQLGILDGSTITVPIVFELQSRTAPSFDEITKYLPRGGTSTGSGGSSSTTNITVNNPQPQAAPADIQRELILNRVRSFAE